MFELRKPDSEKIKLFLFKIYFQLDFVKIVIYLLKNYCFCPDAVPEENEN